MSNIDKIRQEIKRRHDYENEMYHKKKPDGRSNDGWAESLAIMGVLEELLTFLDTLSEEPDKPYPGLFQWHHTLTGSCEAGRKEWCRTHGYQPTDEIHRPHVHHPDGERLRRRRHPAAGRPV